MSKEQQKKQPTLYRVISDAMTGFLVANPIEHIESGEPIAVDAGEMFSAVADWRAFLAAKCHRARTRYASRRCASR